MFARCDGTGWRDAIWPRLSQRILECELRPSLCLLATPPLPALIVLGFPPTAEMSEHGSRDKDSLLLSPLLNFWILLFIVNLWIIHSGVRWGAKKTYFCTGLWSFCCFPLQTDLRLWCIFSQAGASVLISDNTWMWNLSPASHYQSSWSNECDPKCQCLCLSLSPQTHTVYVLCVWLFLF